MSATEVIVARSFSVSPHSSGGVLAVLNGDGLVCVNIKLDLTTNWAMTRALRELERAQAEYEHQQQLKRMRVRDGSNR
jgi:hypothetical protein